MSKLTKSRLAPDQHTIEHANATKPEGSAWYVLQWVGRLPDGSFTKPMKARAHTIGEARAKAREQWKRLRADSQHAGAWKDADPMRRFLEEAVLPRIVGTKDRPTKLAPATVTRQSRTLTYLQDAFGNSSIEIAKKRSNIKRVIEQIARDKGAESGRQARTVMSAYVIPALDDEDLLEHSPMHGLRPDFGTYNARPKPAAGQALSLADYQRVLKHLLSMDPAEGVEKPRRGVYTLQDRINKRRNAIDLTLLQATTGMRITEARTLKWQDVQEDKNKRLWITISDDASKTHKGRAIPVLDDRVSKHLRNRREKIGGAYVVGAPTDPNKEWERQNCWGRAVRPLYREIAEELNIPLLAEGGSHLWRVTLNTVLRDAALDPKTRSSFLGHTEQVNRDFYTDGVDTASVLEAFQALPNKLKGGKKTKAAAGSKSV